MQKKSERKSGILLHITSLPGNEEVGTINDGYAFADYLIASGQSIWQILPLNPTSYSNSPFQGPSVFAGNPTFISLKLLEKNGDLSTKEYQAHFNKWKTQKNKENDNNVDYHFLWKEKLGFDKVNSDSALKHAFYGFRKKASSRRLNAFDKFCKNENYWLDDYSKFMALKTTNGFSNEWIKWPHTSRDRDSGYDSYMPVELIEFHKYTQFIFDEQMSDLKKYLTKKGIELIGDIPIYPGYDSCDVWVNRNLFQLDSKGKMKWVSGVPPDSFSKIGQRWGTPVYKWGIIGSNEDHNNLYYWWGKRFRHLYKYLDTIKIDHFIGFIKYTRIPEVDKNAVNAKWVKGPGKELFKYLETAFGKKLSVIAEDLGSLTPNIKKQLDELGYPGMKVLQFGDPNNSGHEHSPQNAPTNSVMYPGTHDNATMNEFLQTLNEHTRNLFLKYADKSNLKETNLKIIDVLSNSPANRVIIPVQDILWLGSEGRMNTPSKKEGLWSWRMTSGDLNKFKKLSPQLLNIAINTGRYSN